MKRSAKPASRLFILKELILGLVAIIGFGLFIYEYLGHITEQTYLIIDWFAVLIALIFLADLMIGYVLAQDRRYYVRHNWYFIFACIPILPGWAQALRGIRVLGIIRLLRLGEHLDYDVLNWRARGQK